MQFAINRQIYIAAIISLMLFGLVKTDSVHGSELLTATMGEELTEQPQTGLQAFAGGIVAAAGNRLDNFEGLLHQAIMSRIGIPYRSGGIDDGGYDCSGFVWKVFQAAGINFRRATARTYWETLPEASVQERTQFGTLVFFDNSTHVGVVRDAYSFYHASTSQGVTRSNFSEYWGAHIRGYRRVPLNSDLIASR
ncbi:MAG TPA: NlpC/P60 family protein [Blastocatellia bacterium]|nr:NlpC/P60 family protein [Blastocatellia bacterium]